MRNDSLGTMIHYVKVKSIPNEGVSDQNEVIDEDDIAVNFFSPLNALSVLMS